MDTKQKEQTTAPDIAVVFQGMANKANGSTLGFEVGRERGTEKLFLRIVSNDGGGTFTKAWQPVAALRDVLGKRGAEGKTLRFAEALGPAIPQKGRNNAPFVGYVLASLGFLAPVPDKPGEYAVGGEWSAWQSEMLALPVPPPPATAAPAEIPAKQDAPPAVAPEAPSKGKRASKKSPAGQPATSEVAHVIPVAGEQPA